MRKQVSIKDAVKYVVNAENDKCTLLGIGPMSENFLRASLEISKEKDFPLMYIASRNQVDAYKFGGGYVFNSDQKLFREKIESICEEIDYDNVYYLCRDHGGPWQRDKERNDHLPEAEAMEIAKESYKEDILNGFDLLHIDPTKDPDEMCKVVDIDIVFRRTVELIEYCEQVRKEYGIKKEIAYEVGTEETSGGLTSLDTYEGFIKRIKEYSDEHGLPMPIFIVGQTGTLTNLFSIERRLNFLGDREKEQVMAVIKEELGYREVRMPKKYYKLSDLLLPEDIRCVDRIDEWQKAVTCCTNILEQHGKIADTYVNSILKSMEVQGFYSVTDQKFALLHGSETAGVKVSCMSLVISREPVVFGEKKVNLIFCLASRDKKEHIPAIIRMMRMIQMTEFVSRLSNCTSEAEAIAIIEECEKEVEPCYQS